MSQAHKDKIAAANRGRQMTPEHVAKTRRATIPVDEAELRRLAAGEMSTREIGLAWE